MSIPNSPLDEYKQAECNRQSACKSVEEASKAVDSMQKEWLEQCRAVGSAKAALAQSLLKDTFKLVTGHGIDAGGKRCYGYDSYYHEDLEEEVKYLIVPKDLNEIISAKIIFDCPNWLELTIRNDHGTSEWEANQEVEEEVAYGSTVEEAWIMALEVFCSDIVKEVEGFEL